MCSREFLSIDSINFKRPITRCHNWINNFNDLARHEQHISVSGNFETLEGCPNNATHIFLDYCPNLKSLKGTPETTEEIEAYGSNLVNFEHCPSNLLVFRGGGFSLTSLKGISNTVDVLHLANTNISNLRYCPQNLKEIDLYNTPIRELTDLPSTTVIARLYPCKLHELYRKFCFNREIEFNDQDIKIGSLVKNSSVHKANLSSNDIDMYKIHVVNGILKFIYNLSARRIQRLWRQYKSN